MAEPNPDDGLMADISSEYKYNRPRFLETAKQWVEKYAKQDRVILPLKRTADCNAPVELEPKIIKLDK